MTRRTRIALKIAVWPACLAPLAVLLWRAFTDDLGANPIDFITDWLGRWAMRSLLASLALTPLRLLTGAAWPIALRRLLGLFAFFYAALHFGVWIVLDHFFAWGQMGADIVKRPYITVGVTALALLVPLAATSTAGMIRRLGGRNWNRLHRLVYLAAILAVLHFLWLAKVGRLEQYLYAAILSVLLGVRVVDVLRRVLSRRRAIAAGRVLVGSCAMLASLVRAALALVLLVSSGCAVVSKGGAPGARGGDLPRPTREVLPNGVVMIVQPHRASDVVALQLWMRVGGRDEAPDELGLSHYLEHMLFKGTATRPPGSIDRMIEGFGGASNAFTSYDYTHYDVVLPAEHVRSGIELLADIAVNASFPPGEIDGERQVVFEEMRLLEDDTDRFLVRRLYETAYEGHPYGRPILGTLPLIKELTRERLDRYYRKLYVPANMTIVVVGAVTPAHVRPMVAATFARLTPRPGPRATVPASVPNTTHRSADVPRAEKQAYLGLAWKAAPIAGADVFAVDLLTYILGDSPSSRLNQAVRERDRLVFAIESGYGAWEKGGLVTVTARLDPANLDRAERSILDVIRRVQAEGVTEAERQRAIVTAEAAYAFDIETAEGLAKAYGQAETTWNLEGELGYLARLRQVTAAEIQAAARKYFGTDAAPYTARVRFAPKP